MAISDDDLRHDMTYVRDYLRPGLHSICGKLGTSIPDFGLDPVSSDLMLDNSVLVKASEVKAGLARSEMADRLKSRLGERK